MAAALLLALLVPAWPAQVAAGAQVTALTASTPLVEDGTNQLSGTIRNTGAVPLTLTAEFQVIQAGVAKASVLAAQNPVVLAPMESKPVSATWSGRSSGGESMPGPVTVALVARGDAVEARRTVDRVLEVHRFSTTLVGGPTGEMPPGAKWAGWLTVQVAHHGNVPLTPVVALSPIPDGWTFELSPAELPSMAPGAEHQILAFITSPASANPGSVARATMTVRSPAAHAPASTLELASPPVAEGGAVLMTVQSPPSPVQPGTRGTFTVQVENRQNRDETVRLSAQAPADASGQIASVSPATPVSLPRGGKASFTVAIDVPADLQQARAKTYTWKATATRSNGEDVSAADLPLNVATVRKPVVAFALPEPASTAVPGQNFTVNLRIRNGGNTADSFQLSVTGHDGTWPSSRLATTLLNPGSDSGALSWNLSIPPGAAPGPLNLRFVGRSTSPAATEGEALFHATRVESRPFPRLAVDQDRKPLPPDGRATFALDAANVGNLEGTFAITYEILAQKPAGGWQVQLAEPALGKLAPGQSAARTMDIKAPPGLQPDSGIQVRATLAEQGGLGRTASVLLSAMPPHADLTVSLNGTPTQPATLFRDHPGTLNLLVENHGTVATERPVELKVTFRNSPNGTIRDMRTATIPVLGITPATRTHVAAIPVPTAGFQGTMNVKMQVDALADQDERNETNNERLLDLPVAVFGISVIPPPDRFIHPGESVAFDGATAFLVRNLGTRTDPLVVTTNVTPQWTTFDASALTLAPGANRQTAVAVQVPDRPLVDEAAVRVRVEHAQIPGLFVEQAVRLRIIDTEPPAIRGLAASPPVAAIGAAVRFNATLIDATGIRDARLHIVAPDGQASSLAMAGDPSSGAYTAEHSFAQRGEHRVYVSARDGSRAANRADNAAQPLLVRVLPANAPSLHLVSPDNASSLRPGTPIVVAVVGGAAIAEAYAAVDGQHVSLAAANPLQLRTATWPEGHRNVTVVVRDGLGLQATANYTFLVDASPPVVHQIRLTPAAPSAGMLATVEALLDDASGLTSATLRLQSADGRVLDVPMRLEGGRATATFPYPAGLASLAVLAGDAAGNQAVEERPVGMLSEGTKDAPMGSALALAALLLAAVALARRRGTSP